MAHQHHPIARQGELAAIPGGQHGGHIEQPPCQCLRAGGRATPLQGSPQGRAIAAGMLRHRHRPTSLGQGGGQPAQLIGVAPQAGQHQQPGLLAGARPAGRPQIHRQGLAAVGHPQVHPLGPSLAIGQQQRQAAALRQAQMLQGRERLALQLNLAAPLAGQAEQRIDAQFHAGHRQGLQQRQRRHFAVLAQQFPQRCLQQARRAAPFGGGEQIPHLGEHLGSGPAVEQLTAEAAVAQQGCPQQPGEPLTALRLQQVQPDVLIGSEAIGCRRRPGCCKATGW